MYRSKWRSSATWKISISLHKCELDGVDTKSSYPPGLSPLTYAALIWVGLVPNGAWMEETPTLFTVQVSTELDEPNWICVPILWTMKWSMEHIAPQLYDVCAKDWRQSPTPAIRCSIEIPVLVDVWGRNDCTHLRGWHLIAQSMLSFHFNSMHIQHLIIDHQHRIDKSFCCCCKDEQSSLNVIANNEKYAILFVIVEMKFPRISIKCDVGWDVHSCVKSLSKLNPYRPLYVEARTNPSSVETFSDFFIFDYSGCCFRNEFEMRCGSLQRQFWWAKKMQRLWCGMLFLFFVFIGITAEWFSSIYWLMCLYRWGQTQLERIAMARAIKLLQRIKYRWIHTMKRLQLSFPASALATFYSIH